MADYWAHWFAMGDRLGRQRTGRLLRQLVPHGQGRPMPLAGFRRKQPRPEVDVRARRRQDRGEEDPHRLHAAGRRISICPAWTSLQQTSPSSWKSTAKPSSADMRGRGGLSGQVRRQGSRSVCGPNWKRRRSGWTESAHCPNDVLRVQDADIRLWRTGLTMRNAIKRSKASASTSPPRPLITVLGREVPASSHGGRHGPVRHRARFALHQMPDAREPLGRRGVDEDAQRPACPAPVRCTG